MLTDTQRLLLHKTNITQTKILFDTLHMSNLTEDDVDTITNILENKLNILTTKIHKQVECLSNKIKNQNKIQFKRTQTERNTFNVWVRNTNDLDWKIVMTDLNDEDSTSLLNSIGRSINFDLEVTRRWIQYTQQ